LNHKCEIPLEKDSAELILEKGRLRIDLPINAEMIYGEYDQLEGPLYVGYAILQVKNSFTFLKVVYKKNRIMDVWYTCLKGHEVVENMISL